MVTTNDFCDVQSECVILLESLQSCSEYADRLLGFVCTDKIDDSTGEILSLQPLAEEHFENLLKTAKQISSFADRFNNKLNQLNKLIKKISSDYDELRKQFMSLLEKELCQLTRPVNNADGTVSPNKLLSLRIDDAYKRTGTDVVEISVSSLTSTEPQLFMIIRDNDKDFKMKIICNKNNSIVSYAFLNDITKAVNIVVAAILSNM
jgi:hypothetical protein